MSSYSLLISSIFNLIIKLSNTFLSRWNSIMNTHVDTLAIICPWLVLFHLYPNPTALLPNYFKAIVDTVSFHPVLPANIQSVSTVTINLFFSTPSVFVSGSK